MRVKKSAIGSVCIALLPTGFHDAGNFSLERHTPKTDAAHLKLADISAGAATNSAAVANAHFEFWFLMRLCDFCQACHLLRSSRNAQRTPRPLRSSRPSSSFFAVVVNVTFMPLILS